jgi:hypothetical protein
VQLRGCELWGADPDAVNHRRRAPISLADDTLYRAEAVGSSDDGRTSIDHDAILYPR